MRVFCPVHFRSAPLIIAALLLAGVQRSARAEDGKQLYDTNCVSCHGASGKGDGAAGQYLKPKPADFAVALKGVADADVAKMIREGGAANGKSALMPAYKGKLNDAQIDTLVKYVKGF